MAPKPPPTSGATTRRRWPGRSNISARASRSRPGTWVVPWRVSARRPASPAARKLAGELGDDQRGARHRRCNIAPRELPGRDEVGPGFLVEQHAIVERRFRIGRVRQRIVVDGDQGGGVLGEVAVLRDHGRDRFADITHLPARQRHELGGAVIGHIGGRADRAPDGVDTRRREDTQNAGRVAGFGDIDAGDASMGPVAPAEGDMDRTGGLAVVRVAAPAGEQPRILAPLHPGADNPGPGRRRCACGLAAAHAGSLPRAAAASRIALTMFT